MRGPFVWAPINLGDWSRATQGLSLEEKGAAMEILLAYWERGEWPDDARICRLLSVSWPKWRSMQGRVGDAITSFLDRSGFMDERVQAAKTSEERRRAINSRWAKYRKRATQGLDTNVYSNVDTNVIPTTSTEETYTDREEKPTRSNGLGNRDQGPGGSSVNWDEAPGPNVHPFRWRQ
jgi:uncharacterized protein YdaU (DUF1376 family)